MKCGCSFVVKLGGILCVVVGSVFGNEHMTITAKLGPKQEFGGFGIHPPMKLSGACRSAIMPMIVNDLKLTHVRFYLQGKDERALDSCFNALYSYGGSTILDDYKNANPDMYFLLGHSETVDSVYKIAPFVSKWATETKHLINDMGINITWETITNEPNEDQYWQLGYPQGSVFDRRIPLNLYAQVTKALRQGLDEAGLQDVKLYAPEDGNVDDLCHEYVEALRADSEAWQSIAGLFTKTYNMGADEYMKSVAEETGWPYFAAAGANLINWYKNENTTDNDYYAAEMCGRIFNDFNHTVSHWAWYMPANEYYDREAAHRLIWVTNIPGTAQRTTLPGGCSVAITLKYYYLKQLAQTFDVGCRFRYCIADTALPFEDMWWTYGQKPAVCATVANNPDETWTAGVINLAGCESDEKEIDSTHPEALWTFYPPATYDITFKIEDLVPHDSLRFALYRSSKTKRFVQEDSVTMKNGECTVTLAPKELVTIRGAKGAQAVTLSPTIRSRSPLLGGARQISRSVVLLPFAAAGRFDVEVLSVDGRRAIGRLTATCSAPTEWPVPVGALGKGMYLFRVRGPGNATVCRRVALVR